MGQSSSVEEVPSDQREAESLAASSGALSNLQNAFSLLADPQTKAIPLSSLQNCFELSVEIPVLKTEDGRIPKEFPVVLRCFGSAVVDQFFLVEKGGVSWIEFLRGYNKCCGRMVSSTSLNNLLKVFGIAYQKAGLPVRLQFDSSEDDSKISGALLPADLSMLLWMCWILSKDSWRLSQSVSAAISVLPDVNHLLLSAAESCAESGEKLDLWDLEILHLDVELPIAKLHMWALKTFPFLADTFSHFVSTRLNFLTTSKSKLEDLYIPMHDISLKDISDSSILICGRAWGISLSLRNIKIEEISKACFTSDVEEMEENLLYRSSSHGKGLNRFWSHVEGYHGPLLMLIAACENDNGSRRWTIGVVTDQGFENRETFYGSSGALYGLSPAFYVLPPSGKENNFVYSHLHPPGRAYDPHPKPVGIAFGGAVGNERIFIDEDFARVTLRHHAIDKTYQAGPLIPNQGYLPLEATILDVEVWGLGGRAVKDVQSSYKKREELFTEQRRKVDLKKTFGNWEDSPEKMMMNMVTNPNRVEREDR